MDGGIFAWIDLKIIEDSGHNIVELHILGEHNILSAFQDGNVHLSSSKVTYVLKQYNFCNAC